ncbi:MAG: hypothetical protein LWW76_00230 [Burkholderiales bacterium]|nr:hypothetical protein [Burkholderiales bacterium]
MNKYLASLCWLLITVFSVVQFALPVAFNAPEAMVHTTMAMHNETTVMVTAIATEDHCTTQNNSYHTTQPSCTDVLCAFSCASHCLSIVPLTIAQTSTPMMQLPFEPLSGFKPEYSSIRPNTPPPKSA